jgi:hypothetical protein
VGKTPALVVLVKECAPNVMHAARSGQCPVLVQRADAIVELHKNDEGNTQVRANVAKQGTERI